MRADEKGRPGAILIAGPTASGKSALAVRLANRLGGQVINADSMQVYRDLRVLTARPTEEEIAGTPHALYGTVDGAATHSVSLWLAEATAAIRAAQANGLRPILVGGTGLYFKALTQGLSDIPSVPVETRARLRAWAEGQTPATLHAELARRDPASAARLKPTDPQRLMRALEVHESTGESLTAFQTRRSPPAVDLATAVAIALTLDRPLLRARIDQRFDGMIAAGALQEVAALAARNLDPTLPVMRAIGVPQLLQHLSSTLPVKVAIDAAKTASRQYIKRQDTFVRHQLPAFHLTPAENAEAVVLRSVQSLV